MHLYANIVIPENSFIFQSNKIYFILHTFPAAVVILEVLLPQHTKEGFRAVESFATLWFITLISCVLLQTNDHKS